MAKRSRLTGADVRSIPYDKAQRAELVKAIAKAEGVTVRTAQRRITSAGQTRGQSGTLSLSAGNAVRKFLATHPIMELDAEGRTKKAARGNLLVQEVWGSQEEAITRAQDLKLWADGANQNQLTGALGADLYPGSLFDNVHSVEVIYVPEGSRYSEFDVRYSGEDLDEDDDVGEALTAPRGGVWLVRGIN